MSVRGTQGNKRTAYVRKIHMHHLLKEHQETCSQKDGTEYLSHIYAVCSQYNLQTWTSSPVNREFRI